MKTGCQFTTRSYHLFNGDGALLGAIADPLTEPVFGVGAPTLFLRRSELVRRPPLEHHHLDPRGLLAWCRRGVHGYTASRSGESRQGVEMLFHVRTHRPSMRHTSPRGTAPFRGA